MAKMSARKQTIYDWLRHMWSRLVSEGMSEDQIKESYRSHSYFWRLNKTENPWINTIGKQAYELRREWRKGESDVLEMFWEIILVRYQELSTVDLPDPAELPGTPPRAPSTNGQLKHSKDSIKLGERLLINRFASLRRDIEVQFESGKVQLESQILEAIRDSIGPIAKKKESMEKELDEIREQRAEIERNQALLKSKVDSISGKATEKANKIRAECSEKTNAIKEEMGAVDKEDWTLKETEKVLQDEYVEVEKQHETDTRNKFTEIKASLSAQRNALLRDLDLQREDEVDALWAEHLPQSIRQSLDRVPKIAQITKELPAGVRKLLAPLQDTKG